MPLSLTLNDIIICILVDHSLHDFSSMGYFGDIITLWNTEALLSARQGLALSQNPDLQMVQQCNPVVIPDGSEMGRSEI